VVGEEARRKTGAAHRAKHGADHGRVDHRFFDRSGCRQVTAAEVWRQTCYGVVGTPRCEPRVARSLAGHDPKDLTVDVLVAKLRM
jgi:hypothetical protein